VDEPIPHVEVKASLPLDPLFDLLWEMGVAEDDNLKPF
jgi:hypothetical protein